MVYNLHQLKWVVTIPQEIVLTLWHNCIRTATQWRCRLFVYPYIWGYWQFPPELYTIDIIISLFNVRVIRWLRLEEPLIRANVLQNNKPHRELKAKIQFFTILLFISLQSLYLASYCKGLILFTRICIVLGIIKALFLLCCVYCICIYWNVRQTQASR